MNFFFDTATKIGTTLLPVNVVRLNTIRSVLCEKRTIKGWNSRDFFLVSQEHCIQRHRCCIRYPESCSVYLQHQHQFEYQQPQRFWHLLQHHPHERNHQRWAFTATSYVEAAFFFFWFAKENAPVKCKLWKLSKGFKSDNSACTNYRDFFLI